MLKNGAMLSEIESILVVIHTDITNMRNKVTSFIKKKKIN